MLDDAPSTQLVYECHPVLILRLTLDQHSQLYQGVVIDLDEQVVGHFHTWPELVAVLQQWLNSRPGASALS